MRWSLCWLLCVVMWCACVSEQAPRPDGGEPSEHQVPDARAPEPAAAQVTWYRHALPIVQKRCLGCHRSGGIAPFALDRYEDVKKRAALLRHVLQTGSMPPWMPSPDGLPMLGKRHLPDAERSLLLRWLGQPALGDAKDAPPPPGPGEKLAWIDASVDIGVDYEPTTKQGSDDYQCFILDPKAQKPRDIIGYEVRPTAPGRVHHALLYRVDRKLALAKKQGTGGHYYCYGGPAIGGLLATTVVLGAWVPGTTVVKFPQGTGIRITPEHMLVLQIHYNDDATGAQIDRSQVHLQYAKAPIDRPLELVGLQQSSLEILPQQKDQAFTNTLAIQSPGTLWGVMPHMHGLGRRFSLEKIGKDGAVQKLLEIPRWDLNWQQTYFFDLAQGYPLNDGDVLRLTCVYDNPRKQTVNWGENSDDEMCLGYLYTSRP